MANIYVCTAGHGKTFDVINTALLFWPGSKISENSKVDCNIFVYSKLKEHGTKFCAEAKIRYKTNVYTCQRTFICHDEEDTLRFIKQTVYIACSRATGICPPWGILTGIRPMSVYEKLEAKFSCRAGEILEKNYFVSPIKRKILDTIYQFRKEAYYDGVREDVSLYISIPFCPSKCSYCSFVSSAVEKVKKLIEPYLEQLLTEIDEKITLIYEAGKTISTIYIGGGTPGVLTAEQIERLLSFLFSKLNAPLKEFCFEIGRPETVTEEKLKVLQKYHVDRLCINCQTLNDSVLEAVGRQHTAKQFIDACQLAMKYNFPCINVDYIAGLPEETAESHLSSIERSIKLGVENITIHSLSIKRASTWQCPDAMRDPNSDRVTAMLEKGYELLENNEYYPYYIYRQKSTLSNGENIGYAKKGHIAKYNIYMMEDVHSVIGCGAGASTKIIHNDIGRIDRFVNTKYPQEYLKFPEKLQEQIAAIGLNLKGKSE